MAHSPLLGDLIDLNEVLEADRAIDLEQRRQRDRRIGRQLQHQRNKPVSQIRAWLHAIDSHGAERPGLQGVRLYHALCVALLVAGLLAGWALASAVLFYDGGQPINIVNAVVVLVLPQILLLLVWLLGAIPVRLLLFTNLGTTLGFLNPGRLAGHLIDTFTGRENQGLSLLWHPDNIAVLAPAARWLFSFWSQLFAFSFNVGILMSAFYLVTFSDLAFVWSTTLTISDGTFHRLLTTLSTPWSTFLPEAVPSAELIETSRYYRLEDGALADAAANPRLAAELGQWWPFLIAAISCYGLLPRGLTLVTSWYRFRHHLRAALCNLPGAAELLARMNSPLVSTVAAQPEQALDTTNDSATGNTDAVQYALRCPVIDWSSTCPADDAIKPALAAIGIEALQFVHAGGRQSTEQDREVVASLCRRPTEGIGIAVKAWEPPMLDFLDFVSDIRRQCPKRTPIIILLWGAANGVSEGDRGTWQRVLGQLNDPDLHVEIIGQAA